jgi:hypothetical protein
MPASLSIAIASAGRDSTPRLWLCVDLRAGNQYWHWSAGPSAGEMMSSGRTRTYGVIPHLDDLARSFVWLPERRHAVQFGVVLAAELELFA